MALRDFEVDLHHQSDAVELLLALRAADRDDHCSGPLAGCDGRGFEDVFAGPEALTTVYQRLCLGTDAHEEDRGGKDQTVGIGDSFQELLVIILQDANAGLIALVALDARQNLEVRQADVFGSRSRRFSPRQRPLKQQITISIGPWTC